MANSKCRHFCAFCGGSAAAHEGRLGKLEGPFGISKNSFETVYVHTQCAVWSPNISQNVDLTLRSVGKEVRRARNLRCSCCGRNGAATGCRVPSCGKCYHLPCAITESCRFNNELYLMACPDHAALFQNEPTCHASDRARWQGPLAHLKLSGSQRQPPPPRHPAQAVVAGMSGRGMKRRNKMTAEQLGHYIDTVKAAYRSLAEELDVQDGSEPDEAIIAAKNAKRLRKATEQLAPVLLRQVEVAPGPLASHTAPVTDHVTGSRRLDLSSTQLSGRRQQQHLALASQPITAENVPAVGFAAIGGLSGVKQQLREMVLMPLMYPEVMEQLGIKPPRGILLHGPPGTGKTAIVRALAAECESVSSQAAAGGCRAKGTADPKYVALFARKGTDCLGKYAGDAELHLRLLFDMASAAAPAIIFLDELDGLVPARSIRASSSDQIFASVVSVMLALMDGLKDRGQVLIIGATNRPDSIDPALRRPGRFDREVYFNLPTQQDRQAILEVQTRHWQQKPGADLQLLTAAALMAAARRTAPHMLSTIEQQQPGKHATRQQQQQRRADEQLTTYPQDELGQQGVQQQQQQGGATQTTAGKLPAAVVCTKPVIEPAQAALHMPAAASPCPCPACPPPAPSAAADDVLSHGRGGGFVAALTSFVTEQKQQHRQQSTWLAPITVGSPGVPSSVAAEAEALAAAGKSPAAVRGSPAASGSPPMAATAATGDLHTSRMDQQQAQQQESQEGCAAAQGHGISAEQQPCDLRQQAARLLKQKQRPAEQPPQQPPREVHTTVLAGPPASGHLPSPPYVQVMPCDWAAALAAAGPPASKREMNSLASLNPAAQLPAALTPLLLPAFAQVVLLLHRWLLLLAAGTDELAAAAAACTGSPCNEHCLQFEQLLAQFAAVEQLHSHGVGVLGLHSTHTEHPGSSSSSSTHASAAGPRTAGTPFSQVSTHIGESQSCHGACYSLLLSGHGAAGQPDLAAAVLKLLGGAAGAAVHMLSLPGMLLLGDGHAGAGLVAGVREALATAGRGQLLVLYLPRIELWALTSNDHRHPCTAATAAAGIGSHKPALSWLDGGTNASTLGSRGGAMHGVMSSSSDGSDGSDSGTDNEDSNTRDNNGQHCADYDSNNRPPLTSAAPSHSSYQTPVRGSSRRLRARQRRHYRLSTAWGVFEQQLAAVASVQQTVLLLATCQLAAEDLPREVLQVFGGSKQCQIPPQQREQDPIGVTAGLLQGAGNSTSATVQTCCCCSERKPAAYVALSCALNRAAGAAELHLDQQLTRRAAADSPQQPASHTSTTSEQCDEKQGAEEPTAGTSVSAATASAAAAGPAAEQPPLWPPTEPDQEQHQHRQRQQAMVFQQLNAAQQAQAKDLFAQVQQQLQKLGGMMLQDPTLRRATAGAPKQQHRAARPLQPQQVLPLFAVCSKAVTGWYCQLDEFQTDFACAVADVRRAHGGDSRYSQAVAAAAYLQDIVAAACREAAHQLRLYNPWNVRLINAVAEARRAAGQQQLIAENTLTVVPKQPQAAAVDAGADVDILVPSTAPSPRKPPNLYNAPHQCLLKQKQEIHAKLYALAADHLQQWRRLQQPLQQPSSKQCALAESVRSAAGGACCGAGLHSAVQRYCYAAGDQARAALKQVGLNALQSTDPQ